MSRTDKDRPYRIRMYDRLEKARRPVRHSHVEHVCDADLRPEPGKWNRPACAPYLEISTPGVSRKQYRREWFGSERADQRRINHALTAAANGGWLDETEDLIDNRQTHVDNGYHGGWEWT